MRARAEVRFGPRVGRNLQASELVAALSGAAARHGVIDAPFERVLAESDIVSLHFPLTEETRGLIGASELAAMKRGAYLINTCHGRVVDEPALIHALASGHLAGAGRDVLADEPPDPGNPLLSMEQVVLSPHVGGDTERTMVRAVEIACQNVLDGRTPPTILNPEVLNPHS